MDSVRAACTGRSMPALVPLPAISKRLAARARPRPTAVAIARLVGWRDAVMPLRARLVPAGKHLVRVEQPARIEGRLDAALLVQLARAELHRHQVALLHADAVLAGQAAAHLDAQLQDVGAELLRLVEAVRIVGVEHDQRMQVAVAGVEDVGDLQAVRVAHLADAAQHVGQPAVGIAPSMHR